MSPKKIIIIPFFLFFLIIAPSEAKEIDCSDYYNFQSVQVNAGPDKDTYIPQEDVVFRGTLENEKDYPIVDGNVFVRIALKNPEYAEKSNLIIDEFIPLENMALDAKASKDISFSWRVPKGSVSGDYEASFFFSVGKRFNLGGLPFADGVVANIANFKIYSSNENAIFQLDRSAATVNGEKYSRDGNLSGIEPGKGVTIIQPIKNDSLAENQAEVQYDLYFWDSLNEKDRIASRKELVTVPTGQTQDLTYTIPEMKDSVYLLKITAISRIQKSIVNIRLMSDQSHPMLNFPAIAKFPINQGDTETIFTCFGNNSNQDSPNNKVSVILTDKNDKEVGRMEYQGDIAGEMMGDRNDFVAKENYDWLKLTASITDEKGAIVDSYETVYDCKNINPSKCLVGPFSQKTIRRAAVLAVEIIALVFLVALLIYLRKRRNAKNIYIFLFILVSSFLLWGVKGAGATVISSSPGSSWTASSSGIVDYTSGVVPNSYCSGSLGQCVSYSMSATASYPRRLYLDAADTMVIGSTFSPTTPALTPFILTKSGSSVPYTYCNDVTNLSTCNPITWLRDHTYSGTPSGTNPATFNLTFDSALLIKTGSIYATSSNTAVIQCSGQTCTAVGPGIADITYTIPGYTWRGAYRVYGTATVGGVPKSFDTQYVNNNQSGSIGDTNMLTSFQVVAGTTLNVNKTGLGTGTVTSSPSGINCGSTCSANFVGGTVTLTAIPDSGSALTSWTGCTVDPSDGNKCSVVMDQVRIVTATFDLNSPPSSPSIGRDPNLVEEGTGNFVGEPGVAYVFSAISADPDNDQIQYAFDWNNDNVADVWLPSLTTYVDSGISQSGVKSWQEGFVRMKVKACDKHGACSSWSSFDLTIGEKGVCGPAAGNYLESETLLREGFCSEGTPSSSSIALVGTVDTPGTAFSVQAVGNYAYVADGASGLQIVDVSVPEDPSKLKVVGTTGPMGSYSWDLYVTDGYAYMANDDAGLKIVNVSDPANPQVVSTLDIAGDIHDVRASGDYIYLAYQHDGFKIVEATGDKTNPHVISSIPAVSNGSFDNANGMDLAGDFVYLAAKPGLDIINVSNPYAPIVTGSFDASFLVGDNPWPMDANIYGKYAFMVNIGYAMIDVSDPTMPHLYDEGGNWGIYDAGLYGWGMESITVGDSGYIANASTNLGLRGPYEVFNPDTYYFSDPSYNPPGYDTIDESYGFDISGNYAYVAATSAGLKVFKLNTLTAAPNAGETVNWTCSNTGGLEIDGKHSVSCSATKSASGPYECLLPDPGCLAPGACGTLEEVCWDHGSDTLVPDSYCNAEADCGTYECPNPCPTPAFPTTPGGRTWKESHPEND